MSFVWAFCVFFKALLHSLAARSFYWILKPLPSAKRFYFGVSSYVGGWFPPSLHASFIAIFRTQNLLETFLSPFYCTVSSFRAASSCSQGQRSKQELKLSLSCLADANNFCFKHRSAGLHRLLISVPGWVFLGTVPVQRLRAASLCFGCRVQWLLKKGAVICSIYSKSSLSLSIC